MGENLTAMDMRDAVFDTVYEIAKTDEFVYFLTADMGAFSLEKFRGNLPERFFNVGIAEQNMTNMAAGLALSGKKVFTYSITPFAIMRCFEQIKTVVAGMRLNITIIGSGAGFTYENDGPSHHATEDIALMRSLGLKVFCPYDGKSAMDSVKFLHSGKEPGYIRIDKGAYKNLSNSSDARDDFCYIERGTKTLVITTGTLIHRLIECDSENNYSFLVFSRLDKFDNDALVKIFSEYDKIIIKEENVAIGGIAESIRQIAWKLKDNIEIFSSSVNPLNNLCPYGNREYLREINNLLL